MMFLGINPIQILVQVMGDKSIVYRAFHVRNGLLYIYFGKTKQSLEKRKEQHFQEAQQNTPTDFGKALMRFGFEKFEWKPIKENLTDEEAAKIEMFLIKKLKNKVNVVLLNIAHSRSRNMKRKEQAGIVQSQFCGNLTKSLLIHDGKLKPVINLQTGKCYPSLNNASLKEKVSKDVIRKSCNTGKPLSDGTRYAFMLANEKPDLKPGHKIEWRRTRRIRNLINKRTHDNAKQVAKIYQISESSVYAFAKGKYKICKGEWVFCYLDENDQELRTEAHNKALEHLSNRNKDKYVAWHVDDCQRKGLKFFKNINELMEGLNLKNATHVNAVCEGKRAHVKNWRIANVLTDGSIKLEIKHFERPRKIFRKFALVDDDNNVISCVFDNYSQAAKFFSVSDEQIGKCVKGLQKSVYRDFRSKTKKKERLRFREVDGKGNVILNNMDDVLLSHSSGQSYLAIKDDLFLECNSIAEISRKTGLHYKRIKRYLENESVNVGGWVIAKFSEEIH